MTVLSVTEARKRFADTINRVIYARERIVIGKRGRHRVAIVPIEDLELIERIENKLDVAAAKAARRQRGGIAWEKLKADLDL